MRVSPRLPWSAPLLHGCWQLAEDHGTPRLEEGRLFVRWSEAVEAGFDTFDCADIYTGVEELLGRFLRTLDSPDAVRVHTKFVPDRASLETLDRSTIVRVVDRSLRRLGRESLDLVQFHWWDFEVPGWIEAGRVLDDLRQAGKIRRLGVTNFDLDHLRTLIEAGVEVASAQVQYSVLDRRPEAGFATWCREHGIALLAYGALAGGLLSERWLGVEAPGSAENRSQTKYRLVVEEVGGWQALQALLEALAAVAERHDTTVSVAALRWALERPGVRGVIVGTGRRSSLAALRRVVGAGSGDRSWEEESWEELERTLERYPGPQGHIYGLEREPGGRHSAILRTDLQGVATSSEEGE